MKRLMMMLAMLISGIACICSQNPNKSMNHNDTIKEADSRDALVELKTTMGDIVVELFNDTPLHRDNFLKLVGEGFYDGVLFHRVIDEFMVQAGDPKSKDAEAGKRLGEGDPGYTIAAEIDYPRHFHRRGALAAARTGDAVNPERRSSGSQFYIVTGRPQSEGRMAAMEARQADAERQAFFRRLVEQNRDSIESMQKSGDRDGLESLRAELIRQTEESVKPTPLPEEVKKAYINEGGAPHLDGQYTVYGQVVEGMDVVDRIQKVETDPSDRPKEDVRIITAKLLRKPEL